MCLHNKSHKVPALTVVNQAVLSNDRFASVCQVCQDLHVAALARSHAYSRTFFHSTPSFSYRSRHPALWDEDSLGVAGPSPPRRRCIIWSVELIISQRRKGTCIICLLVGLQGRRQLLLFFFFLGVVAKQNKLYVWVFNLISSSKESSFLKFLNILKEFSAFPAEVPPSPYPAAHRAHRPPPALQDTVYLLLKTMRMTPPL